MVLFGSTVVVVARGGTREEREGEERGGRGGW